MKVSYICPVWVNDQETLDLTVTAILSFKIAVPDAELVIIDNASTMGGGFFRQEATTYVRNSENLGFCPAVNQGYKLCHGDLIAVVNNDILVAPEWLKVAEEVFDHDQVGTLHFRMIPYNDPFIYGSGVAYEGKERWCTNSFFVISRYFLDQLKEVEKELEPFPGLIDEHYGRGIYDDYDFAWRIHIAGFKRAYTDKVSYRHMMTHSFNKLPSEQRKKEIQANLDYFINKWGKDPEELFSKTWPKQWAVSYQEGFKVQ